MPAPVLSRSAQGLERVDGFGAATALETVQLSRNALVQLPDLGRCTRLRRLEVSFNRLRTLEWRAEPGGEGGVRGLGTLPALEWVDVGHNYLASVEPLRACASLSTLWCHGNRLSDGASFRSVAASCLSLRAIVCHSNDMVGSAEDEVRRFRALLLQDVPSLTRLCVLDVGASLAPPPAPAASAGASGSGLRGALALSLSRRPARDGARAAPTAAGAPAPTVAGLVFGVERVDARAVDDAVHWLRTAAPPAPPVVAPRALARPVRRAAPAVEDAPPAAVAAAASASAVAAVAAAGGEPEASSWEDRVRAQRRRIRDARPRVPSRVVVPSASDEVRHSSPRSRMPEPAAAPPLPASPASASASLAASASPPTISEHAGEAGGAAGEEVSAADAAAAAEAASHAAQTALLAARALLQRPASPVQSPPPRQALGSARRGRPAAAAAGAPEDPMLARASARPATPPEPSRPAAGDTVSEDVARARSLIRIALGALAPEAGPLLALASAPAPAAAAKAQRAARAASRRAADDDKSARVVERARALGVLDRPRPPAAEREEHYAASAAGRVAVRVRAADGSAVAHWPEGSIAVMLDVDVEATRALQAARGPGHRLFRLSATTRAGQRVADFDAFGAGFVSDPRGALLLRIAHDGTVAEYSAHGRVAHTWLPGQPDPGQPDPGGAGAEGGGEGGGAGGAGGDAGVVRSFAVDPTLTVSVHLPARRVSIAFRCDHKAAEFTQ
jgi:hypothetical protein